MKAFKVGDIVDEKYEIIDVLGQGGMGAVFSARHIDLDSVRALKIPDPSILEDEIGRRMFVREAQAVERLNHPNIARVYDVVNKSDLIYIAMEFIKGIEVSDYLNNNRDKLTVNTVMNMLEQICQALDYAHDQGIIHRDIKPNNIMVAFEDERIKILDFGIARISGKTMADFTLKSAGTPRYMAPEQFKGQDSTRQTDQYSLGVIIYHIFTGHPVFAAETSDALGYQHVNEEPPAIQTHNPNLPKTLNDCILKALSKNAADRYPTCINFYQALRASLIHCLEQPLVGFLADGPQREMAEDELVGATKLMTVRAGEGATMHRHATTLETVKKNPALKIGIGIAAVAIIAIGIMLMLGNGPEKSTTANNSSTATSNLATNANTAVAGRQQQAAANQGAGAVDSTATQSARQIVKAVNPLLNEIAGLEAVIKSLDELKLEQSKVEEALAQAKASWDASQSIDDETQKTIKEFYENRDALREKNRKVTELKERNKSLVERGLKLRESDWVEGIESSALPSESTWMADSLKALLNEPYTAGQADTYDAADRELNDLAETIKKVEEAANQRRSKTLAEIRGQYQTLNQEVGELAEASKPLSNQPDLKTQYEKVALMNKDLGSMTPRLMQMQETDYSRKVAEEHSNKLKELYGEFEAVRKALFQKPIISYTINDEDVEIDYDFEAQKEAFKNAFINNDNYLVIDQEVKDDAIYNFEITYKAKSMNERDGIGGKAYDWYHYYEIKLVNGSQVLDTVSDKANLIGYVASQRHQKAYKEKLAKFEAGYEENLKALAKKIDSKFAEFKQNMEK